MRARPLPNAMQIPKYVVLEHVLRESVRHLTPGDRLPSESELARQFGVSRMTLQRALGALVDDGVISRQQGKGTFFLGADKAKAVQTLTGALESLMVYESNAEGRVLDKARGTPAPSDVRRHLALGPAENVVIFKRLLVTRDDPLIYLINYLPMDFGEMVFDDDRELKRFPIISLLRDKYKVALVRASQTIEAVLADPITGQYLEVPVGSPLLLAERTYYIENGRAAQFTKSWYRSDRYKYSVTLHDWSGPRWSPPGSKISSRKTGRRAARS